MRESEIRSFFFAREHLELGGNRENSQRNSILTKPSRNNTGGMSVTKHTGGMRGGRAAESDDDEEMVLIFGNDGLVFMSARVLAHSIVRCGVVEHTCVRFGCASGVVHRTQIHNTCNTGGGPPAAQWIEATAKGCRAPPAGSPAGHLFAKGHGPFLAGS